MMGEKSQYVMTCQAQSTDYGHGSDCHGGWFSLEVSRAKLMVRIFDRYVLATVSHM